MKNYRDLKRFAEHCGFVVTATTGGAHNVGSKHFRGLAIDVRTRDKTAAEIERLTRQCHALGVKVRDERTPPANQKVWSGAHLHLEITGATRNAVREFQRANDLTIDGIAGRETLERVALIR